jgi:hypothetical protein
MTPDSGEEPSGFGNRARAQVPWPKIGASDAVMGTPVAAEIRSHALSASGEGAWLYVGLGVGGDRSREHLADLDSAYEKKKRGGGSEPVGKDASVKWSKNSGWDTGMKWRAGSFCAKGILGTRPN